MSAVSIVVQDEFTVSLSIPPASTIDTTSNSADLEALRLATEQAVCDDATTCTVTLVMTSTRRKLQTAGSTVQFNVQRSSPASVAATRTETPASINGEIATFLTTNSTLDPVAVSTLTVSETNLVSLLASVEVAPPAHSATVIDPTSVGAKLSDPAPLQAALSPTFGSHTLEPLEPTTVLAPTPPPPKPPPAPPPSASPTPPTPFDMPIATTDPTALTDDDSGGGTTVNRTGSMGLVMGLMIVLIVLLVVAGCCGVRYYIRRQDAAARMALQKDKFVMKQVHVSTPARQASADEYNKEPLVDKI